MKLDLPPELEKIVNSSIKLEDGDDNIHLLRSVVVDQCGVGLIMVSPDNKDGYLGFNYYPKSEYNTITLVSLIDKGITFFDMGDETYLQIHENIKTWPEEITNYNQTEISKYYRSLGRLDALREEEKSSQTSKD